MPSSAPLRLGSADVPVAAALEFTARDEKPALIALSWQQVAGEWQAEVLDRHLHAAVRLFPLGAGWQLEVQAHYHHPTEVEQEAIVLELPGPLRVLGRDLNVAPLEGGLRVDRGTPIVVASPQVAIVGGPGLVAAHYTAPDSRKGGRARVELILDDTGAHPFEIYEQCLDHLPGQEDLAHPLKYAALEHKKRPLSHVRRRPEELIEARATLYPLDAHTAWTPLVVERWPAGARAAVVFTDHADRTDPAALRALLYGTSDMFSPDYGRAGFAPNGIRITKSFFNHGGRGGALIDSPESLALAFELERAGSEVALHSITPRRDERDKVEVGLAAVRPLSVTTWIDHQPYTNCEAVTNQGWGTEKPFGIRDLLANAGVRWVWDAGDLGGFGKPRLLDVFSVGAPLKPVSPIFPLPMDSRLWAFRSTMFFGAPDRMAAAFDDASMDALERGRGLFIAHTYLCGSPRTTKRPELRSRLLVRAERDHLVLDSTFAAAMDRLGDRIHGGRIASLTLDQAAGRLRALGEVQVVYEPDGAAVVQNTGDTELKALTVAVPMSGVELTVDGALELGSDEDAGRSRVWFDLPARGTAVVRAWQDEWLDVPLATFDDSEVEVQ